MEATVDISMYPLTAEYEEIVIEFIQKLQACEGFEVEVNGVSTQLYGDYSAIMNALQKTMKESFTSGKCVFAIKVLEGKHRKEDLPQILR